MVQCKNFCYTFFPKDNIPSQEMGEKHLKRMIKKFDPKFIVFQFERCPTTNKLHMQGFWQPKKFMSVMIARKLLKAHINYQWAENDAKAAFYCTRKKNDKSSIIMEFEPFEFGTFEPKEQGKRSDMLLMYDDIKANMPIAQLLDKYPSNFLRYHSGIKDAYAALVPNKPRKNEMPENLVFFGNAGTGKSYFGRRAAGKDFYLWNMDDNWQDGYQGQGTILIEDFDDTAIARLKLLTMLDRYSNTFNRRYLGTINNTAHKIVITSNFDPQTWYGKRGGRCIMRRFKPENITHLTKELTEEDILELEHIEAGQYL